jgi:hypothetical protein
VAVTDALLFLLVTVCQLPSETKVICFLAGDLQMTFHGGQVAGSGFEKDYLRIANCGD